MVAALPTGNDDTAVRLFCCKALSVSRKEVCWVVAPCGWVIASRRFEGTFRLHLEGFESVN